MIQPDTTPYITKYNLSDIAVPVDVSPHKIIQIEYSEWHCYITDNFVLRPEKGKEPIWFWRWMQYLAFGFKWVKI